MCQLSLQTWFPLIAKSAESCPSVSSSLVMLLKKSNHLTINLVTIPMTDSEKMNSRLKDGYNSKQSLPSCKQSFT
jgi:hypothetical protein